MALKLIYSLERQTLQTKKAGKASTMFREEFKREVGHHPAGHWSSEAGEETAT
jgi:hypothetical protein